MIKTRDITLFCLIASCHRLPPTGPAKIAGPPAKDSLTVTFYNVDLAEALDSMRTQAEYDYRMSQDAAEVAAKITLFAYRLPGDNALRAIIQQEPKLSFDTYGKMIFVSKKTIKADTLPDTNFKGNSPALSGLLGGLGF